MYKMLCIRFQIKTTIKTNVWRERERTTVLTTGVVLREVQRNDNGHRDHNMNAVLGPL